MSDADYEKDVTQGMRSAVAVELEKELDAIKTLTSAAPTPSGRGWDPVQDAAAIASMRAAWVEARLAYERVEGAVAPLFPDIDMSTDGRYDAFLAAMNGAGDQNLFDGEGVTGLHAIERILYADQVPQRVIDLEQSLPGYLPPAFPATEAEALEFKTKLCKKLIDDLTSLNSQWGGANLDLGAAYGGLISLMNEQREKVTLAATGEEESRYSQRTLADLRANLEGTRSAYAVFAPWVASKEGGSALNATIENGFAALALAYDAPTNDAIPAPPATWSAEAPSQADLATPFGKLYSEVTSAVDPKRDGSVVQAMSRTAELLGYPQFVEGE
jgi:iron uptake system component EfeO